MVRHCYSKGPGCREDKPGAASPSCGLLASWELPGGLRAVRVSGVACRWPWCHGRDCMTGPGWAAGTPPRPPATVVEALGWHSAFPGIRPPHGGPAERLEQRPPGSWRYTAGRSLHLPAPPTRGFGEPGPRKLTCLGPRECRRLGNRGGGFRVAFACSGEWRVAGGVTS